jgi:hypothetical protein
LIDYSAILSRKYPDRQWQLDGDEYDGLTFLDGKTKPNKKTLDDLWPEVQTQIENQIQVKQDARASAINKLATIAGLNEEEMTALGL